MILCHCVVVTSAGVADVVRTGTHSLGEVCRATGAGRSCGACVLGVKQAIAGLLGPTEPPVAREGACMGATLVAGRISS